MNNEGIVGPEDNQDPLGQPDTSPKNPQIDPQADGGPSIKKVQYNNKEYEIPAILHDAWQEREKEFAHKLSEQGEELGRLKKKVQSLDQPNDAPKDEPEDDQDLANLAFSDPKAYNKTIKELIRKEAEGLVEKTKKENEAERQRSEALRVVNAFWDDFYTSNPDLKKYTLVAEKLFEQDISLPMDKQEIGKLAPKEASKLLAQKVKKYLVEIIGKENNPIDAIGSGDNFPVKPVANIQPSKILSLTERIQMKRKAKGL